MAEWLQAREVSDGTEETAWAWDNQAWDHLLEMRGTNKIRVGV